MILFVVFTWISIVQAETEVTLTNTAEPVETTTSLENGSIREIDGFQNTSNGISSGKIKIIGNNIVEIPNFHYDGTAPDAHFLVGRGNVVSENGTSVYLDSSNSPLESYNGESVKLTLPDGLSVDNIDWLSVWSHQSLGHVFLKNEPRISQTFNLNDQVYSGPVLLLDKKTLLIPNLHYDGSHQNVRFWVGNGTEPSSEGVAIADETGSSDSLHSYQGQNVQLTLPGELSTDNIEYFAVWSVDEQTSLGYVPLKGIKDVPEVPIAETLSNISMTVPKCCEIGSVITLNGCEVNSNPPRFRPEFKVYEHNATHFSNVSLDVQTITFYPYLSAPNCESGKFALEEENEEFALLQNTSLLVKGDTVSGILSSDKFCLDYIQEDNETVQMKILVCVPKYKIQKAMFVTYVTFTIISTFCFAITFFLYFFWFKVEDVHKKAFTAYVFAMTITFLSLTIVQTTNVEGRGCEVLGFFFQISMIAAFTLLGILCVDIYIIIYYIDDKVYARRRKRWYLAVALGVPILFLIISLSRNLTPDVPNSFFKPQYMRNACVFPSESQRTIIFYVPISISIVISIGSLIFTKLRIVKNDNEKKNDYFWLEQGTSYKFMWRQHLIIVLTSLMWAVETLLHISFANANMLIAIDLVEASQGILVLLLFVVNQRKQIWKTINHMKRKKGPPLTIPEEQLMLR